MVDSDTIMQRVAEQMPVEVRQMIYAELDYYGAIALSQTCRFFQNEVLPDRCSAPTKAAFLARAERFRRHTAKPPFSHFHASYACYDCLRILPRDDFTDCNLAEDGATQACRDSSQPQCFHDAPVQGPLLPGDLWSLDRAGAKVYIINADLCTFSKPRRRSCFQCQLARGGWYPGQAVLFRGVMHRFCVDCRSMQTGPMCYQCHRCKTCMASCTSMPDQMTQDSCLTVSHSFFSPRLHVSAPPRPCPHAAVVHTKPAHAINARYVEQLRRGLVHHIASERGTPDQFMDLVFDVQLDRMPSCTRRGNESAADASLSDLGDDLTVSTLANASDPSMQDCQDDGFGDGYRGRSVKRGRYGPMVGVKG